MVVLVVLAADTPEAELLAAAVKLAPADPALAVGPLTTIAEACIIQTRAPGRCILQFSDRPL